MKKLMKRIKQWRGLNKVRAQMKMTTCFVVSQELRFFSCDFRQQEAGDFQVKHP